MIFTTMLEMETWNGVPAEWIVLYLDENMHCRWARGGWKTAQKAREDFQAAYWISGEKCTFMEYERFVSSFLLQLVLPEEQEV